jgi:hypothetical protein
MFVKDGHIKTRLAALLKKGSDTGPSGLQPYWDVIVTDSHQSAWNEIVRRLAMRGHSLGQINTWDAGSEFEIDISLFWCLTKGAGLHGYDDKFITKLDRRDELDDVIITSGGSIVVPDGDTGDQVGFGYLRDDQSLVTMDLGGEGPAGPNATQF